MVFIESAISALHVFLTPTAILFVILGTVFGMFLGALPGVGGPVGIALLIPFTLDMQPELAFIFLTSTLGGAVFAGSITAILLNIPGTSTNAATLLDGHPLAKQGKANEAIGASAAASAGGAIIGVTVLALMLPVVREVLRLFGPPEFFALAVFGLTIIGAVSRGPLLNGLIAGAFGFFISFVGFNPITGSPRYSFGTGYLTGGIGLLAVLIGVFAISEMVNLAAKDRPIADKGVTGELGSVLKGIRSVFENFWLFIRCSIIGVFVGIIPAAGGTVANFISYMHAYQSASDNSKFGDGDIRGVIGSEASNDAKDGGAMIPTVTFGIPGSVAWAVMLGAFILHGLQPGPQMLTDNLNIIFVMIFALIFSNLISSAIGITASSHLAKITTIPVHILVPVVFIVAIYGTYVPRMQFFDVVVTLAFGLIGYIMIKYKFSRIALIIGLVLGPIAETSFHQSVQISGGSYAIFFTRPIALAILIFALASVLSQFTDRSVYDLLMKQS